MQNSIMVTPEALSIINDKTAWIERNFKRSSHLSFLGKGSLDGTVLCTADAYPVQLLC